MSNIILNTDKCTGCSLCTIVCPVGAIKMIDDYRGFRVPIIDEHLCIECKKCVNTCDTKVELKEVKETYIAKNNNIEVYKASQSGGAFTAISDYILDKGGIIYGAAFDEHLRVVHQRAISAQKRDEMRGSKYIQSNMEETYNSIQEDLKNGKYVLFVGTPCQVVAVLKFAETKKLKSSKLYTVDILCHGVPSPCVWEDMKRYIENKYHSRIQSVKLVELEKQTRPALCMEVGDKLIPDILYRKLYYSNLALRNSCYECKYNSTSRVGDITIGDAWGVEKENPSFNENRGVSLILFNTTKGLDIKNHIFSKMNVEKVEIDNYIQECLKTSAKVKRSKDAFWKEYQNKSFFYIVEKYAKHNPFLNINYIFKRILKI